MNIKLENNEPINISQGGSYTNDFMKKAIVISASPTSAITTIAGLEAIGITSSEVQAATDGYRTVVKDTAKGESYPILLSKYTNANNFAIEYGTLVIVTTGLMESISTYYEVDIAVTNGTVSVTSKANS